MRWLLATLVLVLVLLAGAAWVALRDWQSPRSFAAERAEAAADARELAAALAGDRRCPSCRAGVVDQVGRRRWRVWVDPGTRRACFELDLDRFAPDPRRGFAGVRAAPCGAQPSLRSSATAVRIASSSSADGSG